MRTFALVDFGIVYSDELCTISNALIIVSGYLGSRDLTCVPGHVKIMANADAICIGTSPDLGLPVEIDNWCFADLSNEKMLVLDITDIKKNTGITVFKTGQSWRALKGLVCWGDLDAERQSGWTIVPACNMSIL